MSERIVSRLSELGNSGEDDTVKAIEHFLTVSMGPSLTVKAARDTFSKMIARVRNGEMQLIGRKTQNMTVMISLEDLAALLVSSGKALSFGSALDEVGFMPIGRRVAIAPRTQRAPLHRSKAADSTTPLAPSRDS